MQPYAAFDERGPLNLAASGRVFDHDNILTNAARGSNPSDQRGSTNSAPVPA